MTIAVAMKCGDRKVHVVSTDANDGNFAVSLSGPAFASPRSAIVDLPWTWLNQVHGTDIVNVTAPGEHAGAIADGALTSVTGCPVAVTTADCVPVVLTSTHGVAVVHAGWRGALKGVISNAADKLLTAGGQSLEVWLGPCIGPDDYEFGSQELALMSERFGEHVISRSSAGNQALDMFSVVSAACVEAGWPRPKRPSSTASPDYFSHRIRGDKGRQTTVAWIT